MTVKKKQFFTLEFSCIIRHISVSRNIKYEKMCILFSLPPHILPLATKKKGILELSSISFCFMHIEALLFSIYKFRILFPMGWFFYY